MKNRLWLIIPWALFGLVVVGWLGYWNYVAGEAERRVSAFVEQQNAKGSQVSVGRVTRHGFPVLLRLEYHDVSYSPPRGGWRATTERADLNIEMLNPEHVIIKAEAPIAISRGNGATTNITADTLIASIRTQAGRLAEAGVEADNLKLDDPTQDGVLSAHKFVATVRPDARKAGDYQLSMDVTQMLLPRPVRSFESFGLEVPVLRALVVVENGGELVSAGANDPLGPWVDGGGKVRFEALGLTWGPLETTGSGEGTLDAQRRLQGHLVIPIDKPAPVLTAIANGPNVDDSARRALGLLAAGYLVSGNEITLDVNANDGVLRLEGLPVRPLPPVY